PSLPLAPRHPGRDIDFDAHHPDNEGWHRLNRHSFVADYRGFLAFFFGHLFTEPHSTKHIEDCIGWGLETTPETLIATLDAPSLSRDQVRALCARIKGPVMVIHGDQDSLVPLARGAATAEATGGRLVTLEGAGHGPQARDPVKVNLLLREFTAPRAPVARWPRALTRKKRALFVSSPIGLGHAQRDVAIADELRKLHPGLEIDWLAQNPVTRVLEARKERIHPASALLASDSAHMESEASEHDLHCFQAWRRMDEIMVANFMVFHDLVQDERYDLWIGDEAWEVDYFLHENPEEKRAPYVWLTDFVGWLPMPDGGDRERALTADYNTEMIAQIERFPRLRDRALFVGTPEDIVPDRFGPGLPEIRAWTEEHYRFPGYVTGFDPAAFADRASLRAELGYREGEQVCIVTVGGSGVGRSLLERVIAAFPEAKRQLPALRMVVVAGPRIDPASLAATPRRDLEVLPYVDQLYRHLAACDLAVVQGGLTTTMELGANRRPFLYFPLRHHFEQTFHVRHRLERLGAGRCMDFDRSGPEEIAAAIVEEIARPAAGAAVDGGGAARAAAEIAALL
ncbi:MAG TPA: glycosyltransferase, partial [Polyangiaceae bacterium]|nr:glycosyltransferase [Polyangiaceae bacterium]